MYTLVSLHCFSVLLSDNVIQHCVTFTDSVQKSLEAKFSSGQAGAIPITPSPDFYSRIAVSHVYDICHWKYFVFQNEIV